MATYDVHDAKARLSELLDKVERGEEVVVARDGHAVARLLLVGRPAQAEGRPALGPLAGLVRYAPDFDPYDMKSWQFDRSPIVDEADTAEACEATPKDV